MNDGQDRGARRRKHAVATARGLAALALVALSGLVAGCGETTAGPAARTNVPALTITTSAAVTAVLSATTTHSASQVVTSAPTTRADQPLTGRVVVVDPGHNGGNAGAPQVINELVPAGRGRTKPCNTTGTETDGGYTEAAFNWDVAVRLRALLAARGATVVMTRQNNSGVGPCVNQRAAIGNRAHADAVVAIHADGGPPEGRGFQVIYAPDEGETAAIFTASLRLAHDVHDALIESGILPPSTYDGHNGYSVRNDLAGLNLSTRPSTLVELGNMRNPLDVALQTDANTRQRLAKALAVGVGRFLVRSGV